MPSLQSLKRFGLYAVGVSALLFGQYVYSATAYVPFTNSANVGVVDTPTQTMVSTVSVGGATYSSALSPVGTIVWVGVSTTPHWPNL